MANYTLIWVSKTTNTEIKSLIEEYAKRIRYTDKLNIIELKESKLKDIEKHRQEEALEIIKNIPKNAYIFVCDELGKEYSSIEFAEKIVKIHNSSISNITFIIGGAYGLPDIIKDEAKSLFALSKMTFTHEMVRPILLEQIYRAQTINAGTNYHH